MRVQSGWPKLDSESGWKVPSVGLSTLEADLALNFDVCAPCCLASLVFSLLPARQLTSRPHTADDDLNFLLDIWSDVNDPKAECELNIFNDILSDLFSESV
jgi:hypothetical protein